MNNKSGILVKNALVPYNSEPFLSIQEELKDKDIALFFREDRSIQNSFITGIEIILSTHLFSMIAQGIIYPASYDLLKSLIKKIKHYIYSKDSIQNNTDILIKTQTQHGEIMAKLNKYNEKDIIDYLDTMVEARNKHHDSNGSEYIIIEENDSNELEIMNLNEYLIKHGKRKKNEI